MEKLLETFQVPGIPKHVGMNMTSSKKKTKTLFITTKNRQLPSMKLTAKAPEDGWLEDEDYCPFGFFCLFSGANWLLVVGRAAKLPSINPKRW